MFLYSYMQYMLQYFCKHKTAFKIALKNQFGYIEL